MNDPRGRVAAARPPLSGILVVDLTRVLAGPFCSQLLADLGAEVIKVETPGHGDDSRGYGPFVGGKSAYFLSLNRNKRGVIIDLKSARGREQLSKLVAKADVLLENFRPGTLDRLGFPWQRLRQLNPRLICCRISGFGQTGPYRDRPAYDVIAQAMGGIMSITGQDGQMPTRVGTSIGDIAAALYATVGILAALRVKAETGQGQEIDIAMLDCQVALLENAVARYAVAGEAPAPIGNRHPSIAPFTTVRTADRMIAIAAGNDRLWRRLCELLGRSHLADDPRFQTNQDRVANWHELEPLLDDAFGARTAQEWLALLEEAGIPCGPVNNVADILDDPQVKARRLIWDLDLGGASLSVSGNPIKFSLTPLAGVTLPPPELGEHNAEILDGMDDSVS